MTPTRRFAFRLALALGQPNPDAMLARMPWRIWREWQVFAALEPFGETGEKRADMRSAIVAATIANCLARGKGKPAFEPRDFVPRFEDAMGTDEGQAQREPSTSSNHYQQALAITRMLGGKIVTRRASPSDSKGNEDITPQMGRDRPHPPSGGAIRL